MKVGKKKQNISIFLATDWNLSEKSGYLKKKFLQNLANLGHFFSLKNPLYRSKFGGKKSLVKEETMGGTVGHLPVEFHLWFCKFYL
jgi:hypothetical protein